MIYSGGEGHTLGANEQFGGPSVHCGQILQKNPWKGQNPPVSGNARILGAYGRFGEGRLP